MSEVFQYPRPAEPPGQSLEDQLNTAWAVVDRLAKVLAEASPDKAMETLGRELERMAGGARPAAEEAQSMALIYTLRLALGITDEAGDPAF